MDNTLDIPVSTAGGLENASIQVGDEKQTDLINHVFGCKHHKAHITRRCYLHTLRVNALARGVPRTRMVAD